MVYTCYYCKKKIENENDLIKFHSKNGKIEYKAHKKCRENVVNRNKFHKLLCDILSIPALSKQQVIVFDKISKKGYTYDVFVHAVETKRDKILNDFIVGHWGWIVNTIDGQLASSYRILKEQQKNKEIIKKIKEINTQEKEVIVVKSKYEDVNILDCEDMNKL